MSKTSKRGFDLISGQSASTTAQHAVTKISTRGISNLVCSWAPLERLLTDKMGTSGLEEHGKSHFPSRGLGVKKAHIRSISLSTIKLQEDTRTLNLLLLLLKIGIFANLRGNLGRGNPSISGVVSDALATKNSQQTYFQMVQRNVKATQMARMP